MILAPHIEQYYSSNNNRLQSHKSSFQAWKCVSFGCSLLVIMLLLSKYYEVSSDLHLLLGIGRLLSAQESNGTLSWPPVPIDMVLPPNNETNFGMESLDSNGSMLMSHMHMSLSQELTGNQLLSQEVGAFVAEFKTAKSTLSLSTLLVAIYIVSWILMTLAINDTRISNDISLRNILLLSVFGAIDVAASIGFVTVRVIMFSVKNSSFAIQILGSSGLKDSPVKLSSDQLTAFTALRLIAMRSCSAYVDLYVSTVVALLTILRLYAIVRALTYYRKLRRLTDRPQPRAIDHKPIWSTHTGGLYPPPGAGQASHLFTAHHLISAASSNHQQLTNGPDGDATGTSGDPFRLTSAGYQPPVAHQTQTSRALPDVGSSTFRYQGDPQVPPTHSKLMFNSSPPPAPPQPPSYHHRQPVASAAAAPSVPSPKQVAAAAAAAAANGKPRQTNRSLLQPSPILPPLFHHQPTTITLQRSAHKRNGRLPRHLASYTTAFNPNSSAPDLLYMSGATRPSTTGVHLQQTQEAEEDNHCESDPQLRYRYPRRPSGATTKVDEEATGTDTSHGEPQVVASGKLPEMVPKRYSSNTIGSAYTLLGDQFDGRTLFQVAEDAPSGGKYKRATRYKRILVPTSEPPTLLKASSATYLKKTQSLARPTGRRHLASHTAALSSAASSSCTSQAEEDDEAAGSRRKRRSALPLTEEFITDSGHLATRVFQNGSKGLLLGKYTISIVSPRARDGEEDRNIGR